MCGGSEFCSKKEKGICCGEEIEKNESLAVVCCTGMFYGPGYLLDTLRREFYYNLNPIYPDDLSHYENMDCRTLCGFAWLGCIINSLVCISLDCCDESDTPRYIPYNKPCYTYPRPNCHFLPCEVLCGRLKGLKCMKCSCCTCRNGNSKIADEAIITKQPLEVVVSADTKYSSPAPEIFEVVTVKNCDDIHSLTMKPFSRPE